MTSARTAEKPQTWTRIDGIDLLRGLAIFFVLMNHVNMRLLFAKVPYTHGLPQQLMRSLVWNGQFGVQIFFAVSGFLITSTALRRWGSAGSVSIRGFYLLRFARIAPLMLALLAILSTLHMAQVQGFVVSAKSGGLPLALLAALTFHINVLEARRGYLPGSWDILWSLSVEEMFYLFFPLLCRILNRSNLLDGLLLAFVALGPFSRTVLSQGNPVWREYSYLGGMDAIALGCLTALFAARHHLPAITLKVVAGVGVAFLVFILCFTNCADKLGLGRTGLDMTIVAIGACLVAIAAAQGQWRAPAILKPLCLLGQRSYEVYLTHIFVVLGLFALFVAEGKSISMVPVLFLTTILVSGGLGELVARFYSEPVNRRIRSRFGTNAGKLGTTIAERPTADPSTTS